MVKMTWNTDALKNLSKGWEVPLNGSEASAVASVKKQMKAAGLDPKDSAVRELVREVRAKSGK